MKVFLLLLFPLWIFAHQSGLSYIIIKEDSKKQLNITYKKPLQDLYAKNLTIHYPHHCIKTTQEQEKISKGFIIQKYTMRCSDKGLKDSRIWVEGLFRKDKGVLIDYTNLAFKKQALLRKTSPFISLTEEVSKTSLMYSYIILGIEHILSGYDHLLFVLSLLLLAHNTKALLFAITAFTLSHSITLASAIFSLLTLPVLFVEATIALSIVFLARELLTDQKSLTKKHLGVIAFIFGLLHGFGFSNVLQSIGLPSEEITLALFSFNVGIEIGQIIFILLATVALAILQKILKSHYKIFKTVLVYSIGAIASFWFIERVFLF